MTARQHTASAALTLRNRRPGTDLLSWWRTRQAPDAATAADDQDDPPRGRGFRRGAGPAVLAVLAAIVLAVSACGSSDGTPTTEGAAAAVNAGVVDHPSEVEIVASDYSFTASSEVVAAGPVSIRLVNNGEEDHQVHLARMKPGVDREQFIEAYERDHDNGALALVEPMGGVASAAPGATEQAISVLEPGEYLMICFVPSPDGTSHVQHGMVAPLTVLSGGDRADAPEAGEQITLQDYAFSIPEGFTGQGPVEVRNQGTENHEFVLLRLHDDKTLNDLATYGASGQQGPAPFDFAGGLGILQPGGKGWASLDLEPGQYVAVCAIPDPSGVPHLDLGMVAPFTVT